MSERCHHCGGVREHLFACPVLAVGQRDLGARLPEHRPDGPGANPSIAAERFRDALPTAVHRATAADIVQDTMAIIQRELARFKASKALDLQSIKAVEVLARTAANVRTLERLLEDEESETLARATDAELRAKATGGSP